MVPRSLGSEQVRTEAPSLCLTRFLHANRVPLRLKTLCVEGHLFFHVAQTLRLVVPAAACRGDGSILSAADGAAGGDRPGGPTGARQQSGGSDPIPPTP